MKKANSRKLSFYGVVVLLLFQFTKLLHLTKPSSFSKTHDQSPPTTRERQLKLPRTSRRKHRYRGRVSFSPHPNPRPEGSKPRVACAIYTFHGNRQKLIESYNTWGKYCTSGFYPMSDESFEYAPNRTTLHLRPYPGQKETLWYDMRLLWDVLADKSQDGTLDADFVTFSGDDAFWIMDNLEKYLGSFYPNENDLLLGGIDPERRKLENPWIGGAGYVVSANLVRNRALSLCDPELSLAEDELTSECLFGHGVKFVDTRDSEGNQRFCRDKPNEPCVVPDISNPLDDEKTTPSKEVVLFHYTSGALRENLHKKYYIDKNFDLDQQEMRKLRHLGRVNDHSHKTHRARNRVYDRNG